MKHYTDRDYKKVARIGGISYILLIILGLIAELFVREKLITSSSLETMNLVVDNPMLFKLGFLSDLLMVLLDVVVGFAFYILLKHHNKILALTGLIMRLIQSIILASNLLNLWNGYLYFTSKGLGDYQADLGFHALKLFNYGYYLALIFFGMYLILLAIQLNKTKYFKTIISIFVYLAGILYIVDSIVNFILPQYAHLSGSNLSMLIWIISEFSIAISLIVLSFRKKSFRMEA